MLLDMLLLQLTEEEGPGHAVGGHEGAETYMAEDEGDDQLDAPYEATPAAALSHLHPPAAGGEQARLLVVIPRSVTLM